MIFDLNEFMEFMDPKGALRKKMEKRNAKQKANCAATKSSGKGKGKATSDNRPEWNATPRQFHKNGRDAMITSNTIEEEIEQLRNKLLAASYSSHGADFGALFDRLDKGKGKDYEMSIEELTIVIRKILPKVTDRHLEVLMKIHISHSIKRAAFFCESGEGRGFVQSKTPFGIRLSTRGYGFGPEMVP